MGQTQRRRATTKKVWLVVAVVAYVAAKSAELFQFFGGRSERFVFQVENDLRTNS